MKNSILDLSLTDVDNILQLIEDIQIKPLDGDHYEIPDWFKNTYFAGAGLCIDVIKENGEIDVMTFSHKSEDVGFFSGGIRKLLSIKSIRTLERVMQRAKINHTPKWQY